MWEAEKYQQPELYSPKAAKITKFSDF